MDVEAFRERSRQSWDAVATGWEARCDFLERNMGLLHDWVIERIDVSSGQIVLDVGAGPAIWATASLRSWVRRGE